jgi:hypothetical protein
MVMGALVASPAMAEDNNPCGEGQGVVITGNGSFTCMPTGPNPSDNTGFDPNVCGEGQGVVITGNGSFTCMPTGNPKPEPEHSWWASPWIDYILS